MTHEDEDNVTPFVANVTREESGRILPVAPDAHIYKGESVPEGKTGIAGVKFRERGKNKGKYQAFYQTPKPDSMIFTGPYRDTKELAQLDLIAVKARIYL